MNFLSKWILFAAYFFDFFSFSLIIPLLPLIVFELSGEGRYIALGFLLATYPLAQMIGAPLLGKLADRIGKKQILLLSYLGNLAGYLLGIIGIVTHELAFFFAGHFVSGLVGANMTITHAMISDQSCHKTKLRHFSLTNLLLSLTFVISPLISKTLFLHTPSIEHLCLITFSIAGLATLLNFIVIYLSIDIPPVEIKASYLPRRIVLGPFLFFFAWFGFIKFFQAYILDGLGFSYDRFCSLLATLGAASSLMQVINLLFLTKHTSAHSRLKWGTYTLGLAISALLVFKSFIGATALTVVIASCYAIISPNLIYTFSIASETNQGELMGYYQATGALAKTLAPPICGILMTYSTAYPLVLTSLILALAPLSYSHLRKIEKCV